MDLLKQIPTNITVIAVTKKQSVNKILKLPERITDIAENKIQEAEEKFRLLQTRNFKKHFIGHLQSNKVKKAIQLFDVIQSVDSLNLATKINQHSNTKTNIMLQVNISNDPNKYGFTESQLIQELPLILKLKNLKLIGLMTILKDYDNQKQTETDFLKMQNLFNQINQTIMAKEQLEYLSMGMSQDYQSALKSGSNMLRLGTILFQNISE